MICGGLIGIERGRSNQPAGMRTYMLVCMGAAVVMMTGQYMYDHFQTGDPARLGAQVISGIGFLGAGSIITFGKTKIKGLTTAAGLWTAACIGLSIGIGFYIAGIMTQFKKLEYRLIIDDVWLTVYMEMDDTAKMADIAREIAGVGLEIDEVQIGKKRKGFQKAVINLKNTEHRGRDEVLKYLENMESIQFVKYTS